MRKTILFCIWLLVPLVLLAYHDEPGQSRLALDPAASKIAEARGFEAQEDWAAAYAAWSDALAATPPSETAARFQLRLAQARTRRWTGDLPEAITDLEPLLTEAQRAGADKQFQVELRATLAGGQYYEGWLMRLEGAATDEWLQPVEGARQNFRLLGENTSDPTLATDYKKSLEATIRLERMNLSELQGQPLPKKCSGCKNVRQKCRCQSQSKGENKGEKEKKDARGAGFNDVPKGGS